MGTRGRPEGGVGVFDNSLNACIGEGLVCLFNEVACCCTGLPAGGWQQYLGVRPLHTQPYWSN